MTYKILIYLGKYFGIIDKERIFAVLHSYIDTASERC